MATNPPKRQAPESTVVQWLLDSDPAIRWQVLRDLADAPAWRPAAVLSQIRMTK